MYSSNWRVFTPVFCIPVVGVVGDDVMVLFELVVFVVVVVQWCQWCRSGGGDGFDKGG